MLYRKISIRTFLALALVSASVLVSFSSCGKQEPEPDPVDPAGPVEPDIKVSNMLLYNSGVVLYNSSSMDRWIDFQKCASGNMIAGVYTSMDVAADADLQKNVDIGAEWLDGGVYFRNSGGHTRCCVLPDLGDAVFDGIKSRTSLEAALDDLEVQWDDAHAPIFTSSRKPAAGSPFIVRKFPAYVAVKTWRDAGEGNMYGMVKITDYSERSIKVDYKFGMAGEDGEGEYTGARKVTVSGGKMYVDGREFLIKGAAATMKHTLMAQYGANTCRIYSADRSTSGLLDRLHEAGLMCFIDLSAPSYKDLNGGRSIVQDGRVHDEWYTPEYRRELISKNLAVVNSLKDHPAVLCWSIANETESGSDSRYQTGMYEYCREFTEEIRKVDPNHPVSICFTERPSRMKLDNVMGICPDIDFLTFDTYFSCLKNPRNSSGVKADSFSDLLVNSKGEKYDKPYVIAEFGPTGTWDRGDLQNDELISGVGRINDWGALIQLSSDEAAQNYIDGYNLIAGFDNCMGSIAFWWGYQTHGEVLGWYPFFTKEMYMLPAADALESCWKGIQYTPKAPSMKSWKSSIELNGMNAADPAVASSGKAERNPVLTPGQPCTAEVFSKCRSGNPDSTLRYKWFLYRDNTYSGTSPWVNGVTIVKEYEYAPSAFGRGMSLDEDAGASLFRDRTLAKVEFTAPEEPGGYRLCCIVTDPSNNRAGTVCLNFKVK